MIDQSARQLQNEERVLIAEIYPSLRRFAAVVGAADIEPDDLVQEGLLRALRRGRLTDLGNPGAYVRRAIYNLAANERRRLGRRSRALSRLGLPGGYQPAYPSDLTDLLRLSPKARAVLYLTAIEGRTYGEVADMLGITETSARTAASRGRRKLRNVLSEEENDATA